MNKTVHTLQEVIGIFEKEDIDYILTRLDKDIGDFGVEDLDILVRPEVYEKAVKSLNSSGYVSHSHDQALGGRISGAQVNLVKPGRIKIDLHKDFTWRRARYMDLALVWNNLSENRVAGVRVKTPIQEADAFLVMVNIIFEKTYLTTEEYNLFWKYREKVFEDVRFLLQAKKYGWENTFLNFKKWTEKVGKKVSLPLFLPAELVIHSYWEKFMFDKKIHLISFFYYFFFRVRYLINKTLPYD